MVWKNNAKSETAHNNLLIMGIRRKKYLLCELEYFYYKCEYLSMSISGGGV